MTEKKNVNDEKVNKKAMEWLLYVAEFISKNQKSDLKNSDVSSQSAQESQPPNNVE